MYKRQAFKDKSTVGVILEINSPGGSPVQAGEIYDEIQKLRQPFPKTPGYAVASDLCASGGYYSAAAAQKIYVNKASLVGSIGVRMDSFGFTAVSYTHLDVYKRQKSWWGLVQTRREVVTGRLGARSGAARKGSGLSGE